MSNLLTKTELFAKEDYNAIPVHYCKQCLSLKVRRVAGMDEAAFCDECGCTDITEASIEEWETLYKSKHGFTYLENNY